MKKIVVTGANGFIGIEVVKALIKRGDFVTGFDIVANDSIKKLLLETKNFEFVQGEISEWQHVANLFQNAKPDAVIHCAAIVGVIASANVPFSTMRVNVEGSLNVFESMKLFNIKRVLNLSTEEIYGNFLNDVIDEDHRCLPLMPYGISKFAVEQLARDYNRNHGMDIIHLRTCWVYGPGLPRQRVPKTLIDAAIQGRSLHIENGGDFRVDHVYIDDLVDGILLALDKPSHKFDAYHLASGKAYSLYEIIDFVKELVPGSQISIGPGQYLFGDRIEAVKKGALDITRAHNELSYTPKFQIQDGLKAYLSAARAL